jgi:hypothetical protein
MPPSEMRAAYMQENIRALASLGGDAERIRAAAAEPIAKIMAASRMAWLPIELDLAVHEEIFAAGGAELVLRHANESLRAATRTPLLRPILEGAIRLLGLKPEGIFKWAPQAWSTTFKHCGRVTWQHVAPGHGRVVLGECPPLLVGSRSWLLTAQGAFEGGLVLAQANDARVALEPRPDGGAYELFWRV